MDPSTMYGTESDPSHLDLPFLFLFLLFRSCSLDISGLDISFSKNLAQRSFLKIHNYISAEIKFLCLCAGEAVHQKHGGSWRTKTGKKAQGVAS
jgi:hypothetical protein